MATPRRSPQALPLVIEYGGRTDIGLSRLENQDAWAKFPPSTHALEGGDGHLFVVADGMGGHERGAEASRLAVQTMREAFYADPSASAAERTRGGIEAANARIHALTCAETPPFKMGTTCTVLALVGTDAGAEAVVAHVGDSRLYRVRGGRIEQLTRDHTRVAELQRHGVLREDEVQAHPARTVLTRAVGAGPTVDVDVEGPILLQPGDVFVLCSDGLARVLPDEVRDVALTRAPQPACDALVALANERGGDDNVTVVVVRVGADDDATMTGPAPRSISEPRSSPARLTRPRRAAPRGWVVGAVIVKRQCDR